MGAKRMQGENHKLHDIYICGYPKWDSHLGIKHDTAEKISYLLLYLYFLQQTH